ncbi:MAG: hypothetical protein H7222_09340 [Methylotenera sp.]|nr:hypothetical protein [Oligoflexia bacterium]
MKLTHSRLLRKATLLSTLPLLTITPSALADSLTSDTAVSSDSFIEALSYRGSPTDRTADSGPSWSLEYSRTSSTLGTISDVSHGFSGGVAYRTTGGWEIGGGLYRGTTPDENLTSFGPNFRIGKSFDLGANVPLNHAKPRIFQAGSTRKENATPLEESDASDDGDEPFRPSFELAANFGSLAYQQESAATAGTATPVKRNGRKTRLPANTPNSITQSSFGLDASWSCLDWLSLNASFMKYRYSKNINTFLQYLDSPLAARTGGSGFSSTVGSFPESMTVVGTTLSPTDFWDVDLSAALSHAASGQSETKAVKILANRDLGKHWRLGGGVERSTSELVAETIGHLSIGYLF